MIKFPVFYKKNRTLSSHYSTLSNKKQHLFDKQLVDHSTQEKKSQAFSRYFLCFFVIFAIILTQFGGQKAFAAGSTGTSAALAIASEAFATERTGIQTTFATTSNNNYVSANVNNFKFSDFTADYYLYKAEDGTSRLKVVEQFTAEFPSYDQNHGFIRVIPFTNQNGANLTMESDSELSISIKHNGIPEEPYDVSRGDGYFEVTIREPTAYVHGTQYYELTYEFRNVITDFSNFQELYWDTNGNDWAQKFDRVAARVHIEEGIFDKILDGKTSCYVGSFGASGQDRCEIRRTGEGYEFIARDLKAGENLTYAINFEPETFAIPEPIRDYRYVVFLAIQLVILAMVLLLILYYRNKVSTKREFYRNYFIKPEYQPAKGFSVAEMSKNYMSSISDSNASVATLIEMAIQGKIEIIKRIEADDKWKIRVKSIEDMTAWELNTLQVLEGEEIAINPGDEINITKHTGTSNLLTLTRRFGGYVKKALKAKGLFEESPKTYGSGLRLFGTLWFMVGLIIIAVMGELDLQSYTIRVGGSILPIFNGFLCILICVICWSIGEINAPYNIHTKLGLEYSRYMDGLKLYIKMAEADRLKFLQSVDGADTSNEGIVKLYEKLLPYAVAFGLEKSWSKEMSRYYELSDVSAPTWYTSNSGFNALMFSSMINSVTSSASSSVNSGYSYSSSSGSSSSFSGGGGGGFSGGGGGGGGGRGC